MIGFDDMRIDVHPNALKHGFSKYEVAGLWSMCHTYALREENKMLALSSYKGKDFELIAKRLDVDYFLVYHCFTPPTKKFLKELERSM